MTPSLDRQAWVRCGPYIDAALKEGRQTHSLLEVLQAVEQGRAHFWPGQRCAVVTEFWQSPRTKGLNFWLIGGDLKELLEMRPRIEAWAQEQDCKHALGGGPHARKGWARVLLAAGFRPRWTIYEKELGR